MESLGDQSGNIGRGREGLLYINMNPFLKSRESDGYFIKSVVISKPIEREPHSTLRTASTLIAIGGNRLFQS